MEHGVFALFLFRFVSGHRFSDAGIVTELAGAFRRCRQLLAGAHVTFAHAVFSFSITL